MGSDLFALSALARELNDNLQGARIDKIQQPESDELRFFVRSKGKISALWCLATQARRESTSRRAKSQSASRAESLYASSQIPTVGNHKRRFDIQLRQNRAHTLRCKTEMRDEATFYLFVEIMNRYSNIVFTDENLVILDAVKHLPLDVERNHVVLRGVPYSPVSQKNQLSNRLFFSF